MLNRVARSAAGDNTEDLELLKPFCHAYRLKYPVTYLPVNVYRALESLASSSWSSELNSRAFLKLACHTL